MTPQTTCPKCASDRWMRDLWVLPTIAVSVGAPNILGMGAGSSEIRAEACGNCGYTEIYARDARSMWRERKSRVKAEEDARRPNLPLPSDGGTPTRRDLPRPSSPDERE